MFIAIPVGMNYRTERYPVVTLSLIGLNTLVYLVSLICFFSTDGASEEWIYSHLWLTPGDCTWYACLTSMFVHAGIFHLAGNMIFLFLFGSCVEDMIGRLRFAIFYLVGGVIAEFSYIAMSPEHFASLMPMGGASGAISACMGMYLLLRTEAQIEFKYFFFFWFIMIYARAGEFEVPAWMAIGFWFLKDLAFAVWGMLYGHGGGGVAFGAHVGGLLGGAALLGAYHWLVRRPELKAEAEEAKIDPMTLMPRTLLRQPVAAASETPTIYLHDGAQQTGPFTLTQIQAGLHDGSIPRETLYWSEGMSDWQNVTELSSQPMS